MRITTGEFKGRRITLPKGSRARPVTGGVLEQVMNLFTPQRLAGGPFLDICAGSGIVGLEALSRGAPIVVTVDVDSSAIGRIRGYIREWGVIDRVITLKRDGRRCFGSALKLIGEGRLFNCIFLDPPYIKGMPREMIRSAGQAADCLAEDGLIIIRSPEDMPETPDGLQLISKRDAGNARLWLYSRTQLVVGEQD